MGWGSSIHTCGLPCGVLQLFTGISSRYAHVCMHTHALSEALDEAPPVSSRELQCPAWLPECSLSSPWPDWLLTGVQRPGDSRLEPSQRSLVCHSHCPGGLPRCPPNCRWQRLKAAWLVSSLVLAKQGHSRSRLPWKHLHQNYQHPPRVPSSSSVHSAFSRSDHDDPNSASFIHK